MTREDIIRMAREAGFVTLSINEETWIPYLDRFAGLVAAAEREACAKVCEAEGERSDASWVSCFVS